MKRDLEETVAALQCWIDRMGEKISRLERDCAETDRLFEQVMGSPAASSEDCLPDLSDAVLDEELRRLGIDPVALAERGAEFVARVKEELRAATSEVASDDEPETPEEASAVAEARANPILIDTEELRCRLGL